MSASTAKPPHRWIRFSLKTLLIVVTVVSVPLGWVGWERGKEQSTISWVEKMGGYVVYENEYKLDDRSWWEEWTDKWVGKWVGKRVWGVRLSNTRVSDLSPLAELKNLDGLCLITMVY